MRGPWLLLRSHSAPAFLLTASAITVVACALGPGSRVVITRDGALGQPLPFVLPLAAVAAMICLIEPALELTATMPRRPRQVRAMLAGFIVTGSVAAVAVSGLVAPALVPASARNVLLALTVTFVVALWQPLLSWVPTSVCLAISWFYGTATYDDGARSWALPAQPPDRWLTGICALAALAAAALWVYRPLSPTRRGALRRRTRGSVDTCGPG